MGLSFPLPNPVAVSQGGTGTQTVFTAGSVVFAGAAGVYAQDNTGLFWDATNHRLGIGNANPQVSLDVRSGTTAQESRVYRTYTDTSNGEWAAIRWNGTTLEIGAYANGTGVLRNGQWVGGRLGVGVTPADLGAYQMALHVSGSSYSFLRLSGAGTPKLTGIVLDLDGTKGFLETFNNSGSYRFAPMTTMDQTGLTNAKDAATGGFTIDGTGNVMLCGANANTLGAGVNVVGLCNVTTAPSTTPSGGGCLYAEGGALKWLGSSGTRTTIGPA